MVGGRPFLISRRLCIFCAVRISVDLELKVVLDFENQFEGGNLFKNWDEDRNKLLLAIISARTYCLRARASFNLG
jgi:hypothetical protein